jgi:hypothetical protein
LAIANLYLQNINLKPKNMERIKVSCYVDASNLRSILNLPELKDNGVSGSDLDGVSEIILDLPTLPLEDDNQRTQFVNSILGAAIVTIIQWKSQQKGNTMNVEPKKEGGQDDESR